MGESNRPFDSFDAAKRLPPEASKPMHPGAIPPSDPVESMAYAETLNEVRRLRNSLAASEEHAANSFRLGVESEVAAKKKLVEENASLRNALAASEKANNVLTHRITAEINSNEALQQEIDNLHSTPVETTPALAGEGLTINHTGALHLVYYARGSNS